eukprot:gene10323-11426_t
MDILSLARYVPKNVLLTSINEENTRNSIKRVIRHRGGAPRNLPAVTATTTTAGTTSSATTPSTTDSTSTAITSSSNEVDAYSAICQKIMFPYMTGCEPDGHHAKELHSKYPQLSRPDIVRFLVARKGQIKAAEEMIVKYLQWRGSKFPLQKANVLNAFLTQCFFPYGRAKDGSPVVYMRGGLYDSNKATPEQYVLAAAYTIDWSLKQHPGEVNVTVIVHTVNIPGGPNQSADMNFIKLFSQVLSDNYPERLKRLVLFPFPWYGRAIWGVVKVFVDKRTQDKVLLLSTGNNGIPNELLQYMDPASMPEFAGGTCKDPIVDLLETFDD